MRRLLSLAAVGMALALIAGPTAIARQAAPDARQPDGASWSERGVFVFYHIVLDFQLHRFAVGKRQGRLEDCSNADWYCLTSDEISPAGDRLQLALPRTCAVAQRLGVGDVLGTGPVRNEVLRIDRAPMPPIHGGSGTLYWLGDPRIPNIVYVYGGFSGIEQIIRSDDGTDRVAKVKHGDLDRERMMDDRNRQATLDAMGRCRDWDHALARRQALDGGV